MFCYTSDSESRLNLLEADPDNSISDLEFCIDDFLECLDFDPIERSLL